MMTVYQDNLNYYDEEEGYYVVRYDPFMVNESLPMTIKFHRYNPLNTMMHEEVYTILSLFSSVQTGRYIDCRYVEQQSDLTSTLNKFYTIINGELIEIPLDLDGEAEICVIYNNNKILLSKYPTPVVIELVKVFRCIDNVVIVVNKQRVMA